MRSSRKWLATCTLAALVACGGDEPAQGDGVATVSRDAQLLYTLEAGTEWIGAVGRDGQARAQNDAARTFAATLAADHQQLNAAYEGAVRTSGTAIAESGAGQDLIANAQATRARLQSVDGADFDLVFVEGTIRLQQQLLSAIERDLTLLRDPPLRQLAEQTRPTLEAHILRGRQLLPELRAEYAGGEAAQAGGTDGRTAREGAQRAPETPLDP